MKIFSIVAPGWEETIISVWIFTIDLEGIEYVIFFGASHIRKGGSA